MPIQDVLREIRDPGDRLLLRHLANKYVALRTLLDRKVEVADAHATLRIERLESENMELRDQLAASERARSEAVEMGSQWVEWAERNIPVHEDLLKKHAGLLSRISELESRNASLEEITGKLLQGWEPAGNLLFQSK
jgi:hypothetical protein